MEQKKFKRVASQTPVVIQQEQTESYSGSHFKDRFVSISYRISNFIRNNVFFSGFLFFMLLYLFLQTSGLGRIQLF